MRKKYHHKGDQPILDVLHDEPRGGRPLKFDSTVEAKVTMIACSEPPSGAARWTLHLSADRLVKLDVVDTISYESFRTILKMKPPRSKLRGITRKGIVCETPRFLTLFPLQGNLEASSEARYACLPPKRVPIYTPG